MKVISVLAILLTCVGCSTVKPVAAPPSVSTSQVIDSLNNTKEALESAGEQNTVVAQKIEKALTLAERLDALLEQIEEDYKEKENKNIIKPL